MKKLKTKSLCRDIILGILTELVKDDNEDILACLKFKFMQNYLTTT